jgi:DNA-binding transcriptional regulator PaaX
VVTVAGRGRPVGYRMSQEQRDRVSQSQREVWSSVRGPWVEAVRMIRQAIDHNDSELAHDILDAYINTERN